MKRIIILTALILTAMVYLTGESGVSYGEYFTDATMRVDYHHIWNGKEELVSLDRVMKEGPWAGSRTVLCDPFRYGRYRVKILDEKGSKMLYSRGFDSYFGEYITTGKAQSGKAKTYHESTLFPYPRNKVIFSIEKSTPGKTPEEVFRTMLDPSSVSVIREKQDPDIRVIQVHHSGPSPMRLDLAVVAEGYTESETVKVKKDLNKVKEIFFSQEPYLSMKNKINIWGLFKPSQESGPDEPRVGKFRKTAADTTFNSMGSPRYLLTEANRKVRDITAAAPCDAVLIMVNSSRYGGGGIYNSFCTFTIDNEQVGYLILHEFGHSFSGLADEYYSSSVAYNEFYPRGIEPAEPNITALLDKTKLKWAGLVKNTTVIPTPWMKTQFDKMNTEFGKKRKEINLKIEKLTKSGAPAEIVQKAKREIELLMLAKEKENSDFFKRTKKTGVVGAYEGAGYSSEGLFRPMVDCIMFTIGKKPYCTVCEKAVKNMIAKYSD